MGGGQEGGNFLGVIDMLIILIMVTVSQLYTYVKMYPVTHFKYVQFIACQLYLREAVPKPNEIKPTIHPMQLSLRVDLDLFNRKK